MQPRKSSSVVRSCTISVEGTMVLAGYHALSMSRMMRLVTTFGAPSFGVMDFTVPSAL